MYHSLSGSVYQKQRMNFSSACELERRPPPSVAGIHIHVVLNEYPGKFHMSALQRGMQRSRLVLVLGIHIHATLDERPSQFLMSAQRREMQRSRPVIVL